MPLAPRVAAELRADGHDAVHLSEQRLSRLADEEIFAKAMSEGRTIVTADLDFGEILARTGSKSVSVIVLRLVNLEADRVVMLLRRALVALAAELDRGVVVSVEESRFRVRRLPLGA